MATNNKRTVEAQAGEPIEEKKTEIPVQEPSTPAESTYAAEELARAHKTFGTSYAIVATALKIAGKERATIKEAKEIVETFKNKEVK